MCPDSEVAHRPWTPDNCALTSGFDGQLNLRVQLIEAAGSRLNSAGGPPGSALSADSGIESLASVPLTPPVTNGARRDAALLQARLIPCDTNQKVAAAVHIVRNHNQEDRALNENPFHHDVIGSSAVGKQDYLVSSEVGCVCKLIHGATED